MLNQPGTYIRIEKTGDNNYSMYYEVKKGGGVNILGPNTLASSVSKEQASGTITGPRSRIEHELLRMGISMDDISSMLDEADKDSAATVFLPADETKPDEVEVEKVSYIIDRIHNTISGDILEKIADDVALANLFSLNLIDRDNVLEFLKDIPTIENVIDYLCKYFLYKNVGLVSEYDKISQKELESIVKGLQMVSFDMKKYQKANM